LLDLGISFAVLIVLSVYYGIVPGVEIMMLIPFVLLSMVTALGVGLWLAALNVQYRDVRYALPFIVQFWLFATPIAYPSSLLHEPWRTIFGVNPIAGVVEGFRWAITHADTAPGR